MSSRKKSKKTSSLVTEEMSTSKKAPRYPHSLRKLDENTDIIRPSINSFMTIQLSCHSSISPRFYIHTIQKMWEELDGIFEGEFYLDQINYYEDIIEPLFSPENTSFVSAVPENVCSIMGDIKYCDDTEYTHDAKLLSYFAKESALAHREIKKSGEINPLLIRSLIHRYKDAGYSDKIRYFKQILANKCDYFDYYLKYVTTMISILERMIHISQTTNDIVNQNNTDLLVIKDFYNTIYIKLVPIKNRICKENIKTLDFDQLEEIILAIHELYTMIGKTDMKNINIIVLMLSASRVTNEVNRWIDVLTKWRIKLLKKGNLTMEKNDIEIIKSTLSLNHSLWKEEIHYTNQHDTRMTFMPNKDDPECDTQYGINIFMYEDVQRNIDENMHLAWPRDTQTEIAEILKPCKYFSKKTRKRQEKMLENYATITKKVYSGIGIQENKMWRVQTLETYLIPMIESFLLKHIPVNQDYFREILYRVFGINVSLQCKEVTNDPDLKAIVDEMKANTSFTNDDVRNMVSRVAEFIYILDKILFKKYCYLSLVKYFFQFLVGIEYTSYLLSSCRKTQIGMKDLKKPHSRFGGRKSKKNNRKNKSKKINLKK